MPEFTGERVIPGQVDADLLNEHFARYAFAARLSRRKHVLDAGCGSGYGAAEIARVAAQVLAIDRAPDAVAFARAEYNAPNLRFEQADCNSLPAADGSMDLVVAFEVIEHLEDWRGFLTEVRRVLAPSGQFIVSTPNKLYYSESRKDAGPNPFHVHEFEHEEFRAALSEHFPHVLMFLENHAEGVVFEPAGAAAQSAEVRVDEGTAAPEESHFFVAVCALRPQTGAPTFVYMPRSGNVLRERERHIELLENEVRTKNQWLERATADLARLNQDHQTVLGQFRTQIAESEEKTRWAEGLNRELQAAAAALDSLRGESEETARGYEAKVRELEAENEGKTRWALETERRLSAELEAKCAELAQCVELLQKAEKTADERTQLARDAQSQLEQLRQQVTLMKESRWLKLGRTFRVGPDLEKLRWRS